ncbi:putative metabolite transport protein YfiG [Amphibalanus amphitrite]|uniref:Putative metabolite transport protein YfiG n=1 Tax=Amphibalanus amphitrite TaxID=1232801 RepID=A0A6A4WUY8_AMPAM|nr:putative metabolite transport protein YfiG [Amphibalanus amphitrite]
MAGDDADGRNKSEDTKRGLLLQASAYAIGNIPGFLLSSYANPRLGTIRLVQLCAPVLAGGWLLLALGNSFWTMLAGRALTGIGVGTAFGPTITHIAPRWPDYAWVSLVLDSGDRGHHVVRHRLCLTNCACWPSCCPTPCAAELGGIVLLLAAVVNFGMLYAFPALIALLGMPGVYWFFAAMHVAMLVFAKFFVPQTRGKTIEEIQKMFEKDDDVGQTCNYWAIMTCCLS